MPIKNKDQRALDEIYANYKANYEGVKEDFFALLYFKKNFDVDPEEVIHQIALGGNAEAQRRR